LRYLTGNPTPGTPQPDPPNLADRITLTGCVRWAAPDGRGSVATRRDFGRNRRPFAARWRAGAHSPGRIRAEIGEDAMLLKGA